MKRNKTMAEKNNDALLFWGYLGQPIMFIVGTIIVIILLVAGFSIKGLIDKHNEQAETKQEQQLSVERTDIAKRFIKNNPSSFGTVTKQWLSGSFYYAESEKGEFTIVFNDQKISKVFIENKAGQMATLYERKD